MPMLGVTNLTRFYRFRKQSLLTPCSCFTTSPGAIYADDADVISIGGDSSFEYNEALSGAGG